MTFLHSEFFFWMVPPVAVLFYFWQTQKPFGNRWLEEGVLRKLRAPEITMGLKGRNALFLIASLLLIAAMAQPVIPEPEGAGEEKGRIVFALQTGARSDAEFEKVKELALEAMGMAAGNEMALVAFDREVYRVSPLSDDYPLLSLLVRNLPKTAQGSDFSGMLEGVAKMEGADMIVVVAAEWFESGSERVVVLDEKEGIPSVVSRIGRIKEAQRRGAHVPLFYYPLGLAMILILLALSSMSKRRSVGVAAMVGLLAMFHPSVSEAGLTDFALLHEATEAYEKGDYPKSAALFARYQQSHDTPQVRYNRANALYKAGRYEQAAFWYRHVYSGDPELEKRRRHNLAQALRQTALQKKEEQNTPEGLQKKEQKRTGGKRGEVPGFTTRLYRLD